VLADCLEAVRDRGPAPTDVSARVLAAHPREGYDDAAAWEEDAKVIAAQVAYGLTHLAPGSSIVGVEAFHRWRYAGDALTPSFTLGARADLILMAVDAAGRPYLEVIDWKSGKGRGVDLLQEVALRIVTRHAFGNEAEYIVNTTVFVEQRWSYAIVRDDATCRQSWRAIKGSVLAIETERVFPPRSSNRCLFCPFFGNGCILDRPVADGEDTTAAWLEGDTD